MNNSIGHGVCQLKVLFFILFALVSAFASADELKPFASDGCSAFPEGTVKQNVLWLSCCQQHDYAYWQGGTYQQRLDADKALRVCVSHVGEPNVALLMLAGVRVGGTPFLPTSFRWGYGWPYPRLYGALNKGELAQIRKLAPSRDGAINVR